MSKSIATILREIVIDSESPRLDLELLIMHVLVWPRTKLISHREYVLSQQQYELLQALITKRQQGIPIAYITGERAFWTLNLTVNESCLIPRPETELLVETTLALLPADACCHIADLGTGSGAIALALASERPHWQIYATDNSTAALAVAQENATRLNISNVQFYHSDWLQDLPKVHLHAIVANPPYIAKGDPDLNVEVARYEPSCALYADDGGFAEIAKIIQHSAEFLRADGILLLEHGANQSAKVKDLFSKYDFCGIETYLDLAKIDRVTLARAKIERSI